MGTAPHLHKHQPLDYLIPALFTALNKPASFLFFFFKLVSCRKLIDKQVLLHQTISAPLVIHAVISSLIRGWAAFGFSFELVTSA